MFTEYAEPTSVDEMRQRYAKVAKACYRPPNAVEDEKLNIGRKSKAEEAESRMIADRERRRIMALIKSQDVELDSHVRQYRMVCHFKNIQEKAGGRKPVEAILREVALKHGIGVDDIRGRRCYRKYTKARHEAMARVYTERPDLSLPQIGRLVGGRDHTTVLHAVKKMGVHEPIPNHGKRSGYVETP